MTILISALPPPQGLHYTDLGLVNATGQSPNIDEAHDGALQQLAVVAERKHADAVFGVHAMHIPIQNRNLFLVALTGSAVKFT